MPQWDRDRIKDIAAGKDERQVADCTRAVATWLIPYDHHHVIVGGRPAVLLTSAWRYADLGTQPEPLLLEVAFAGADRHPAAPAFIQQLVDKLVFRPWGSPSQIKD